MLLLGCWHGPSLASAFLSALTSWEQGAQVGRCLWLWYRLSSLGYRLRAVEAKAFSADRALEPLVEISPSDSLIEAISLCVVDDHLEIGRDGMKGRLDEV